VKGQVRGCGSSSRRRLNAPDFLPQLQFRLSVNPGVAEDSEAGVRLPVRTLLTFMAVFQALRRL